MTTNEKNATEVVMYDSPEAAQLKTVTGWVSREGRFFGNDEHMARWSGCTHKACDCGKQMKKEYLICESCRAEKSRKRFFEMQAREWDGTTPLVIHDTDTYFFSEDELLDYCEEQECNPDDLMLVECEPNYYFGIDADYWSDIMPHDSDGDIPKQLQDKLNELNEIVKKLPAASYSQGKIRVSLTTQQKEAGHE